jgi:hypothetical protein
MHLLLALLTTLLSLVSFTTAQAIAAGGGAAAVPPAAVQYPVVVVGPSLATVAGATTAINKPFTQTFVTPLGSWAYATPSPGTVGLGSIQGNVGGVKTK